MKHITIGATSTPEISSTLTSSVNRLNSAVGNSTTSSAANAQMPPVIRATIPRILGTLSYFAAPMFCATLAAPAVVNELDTMPINMDSLLYMPESAVYSQPLALIQRARRVLEKVIAAICMDMGMPSLMSGPSTSRCTLKLFHLKSKPNASLCL